MFDFLTGPLAALFAIAAAVGGFAVRSFFANRSKEKAEEVFKQAQARDTEAANSKARLAAEASRSAIYSTNKELTNEQEKLALDVDAVRSADGLRTAAESLSDSVARANRQL